MSDFSSPTKQGDSLLKREGDAATSVDNSLLGACWVHSWDLRETVGKIIDQARPQRRNLSIEVTWPVAEDGCWCLRNQERPHPHDPGLGKCPPEIAHDNYVNLTVGP